MEQTNKKNSEWKINEINDHKYMEKKTQYIKWMENSGH